MGASVNLSTLLRARSKQTKFLPDADLSKAVGKTRETAIIAFMLLLKKRDIIDDDCDIKFAQCK